MECNKIKIRRFGVFFDHIIHRVKMFPIAIKGNVQ